MSTEYYFGVPAHGWTTFSGSSFQVRADTTASSYISNNATKLYLSGEMSAKLAGVALNLNSPAVLAIGINGDFKSEWKDGEFQFCETIAAAETTKAKAALQATQSALTDLETKVQAMKATTTEMSNHASAVSMYAALLEA